MSFFKDKVVVVTGGTDGIGKALVSDLLAKGAKVATCGRDNDKLYRLQSQFPSFPLHTMVCDVAAEHDCKRFIETTIKFFGGIDIIINNAGISMRALMKDATTDVIRKIIDINFMGVVYCTKYALDSIIERKEQLSEFHLLQAIVVCPAAAVIVPANLPCRAGWKLCVQN
jgi:NADP-dependent 3-hydroxy acid dehydrogenase YdfG